MKNIWCASGLAMTKAANKNYLSLYNAHSTQKVSILRAQVQWESVADATTRGRRYNLFRFTTIHSGGTIATARAVNSSFPNYSGLITARADGQTVGGVEGQPLAITSLLDTGKDAGGRSVETLFDWLDFASTPIVLNVNEGAVIQNDSTAGTGLVSVILYFEVQA